MHIAYEPINGNAYASDKSCNGNERVLEHGDSRREAWDGFLNLLKVADGTFLKGRDLAFHLIGGTGDGLLGFGDAGGDTVFEFQK